LPVILFPYINFINRFSVFYNSYCILIGYYFTLVGLLIEEYIKPGSVFPLLLRPYSSNFGDITKVLIIIVYLDKGMIVDLLRKLIGLTFKSNKVRLYIFPIYYTGDML
ncbi:hypothetical protein GE21DRAFT_1215761, partial [Neurospora crassa]